MSAEYPTITISTAEMARMLNLPPGQSIKDVWTVDYDTGICFVIGSLEPSWG